MLFLTKKIVFNFVIIKSVLWSSVFFGGWRWG